MLDCNSIPRWEYGTLPLPHESVTPRHNVIHISQQLGNNLIGSIGSRFATVDDFVAAKASDINKSQQLATSGLQQVQRQSFVSNKFQQVSMRLESGLGPGVLPGSPRGTPLDSIAEILRVLKAVET